VLRCKGVANCRRQYSSSSSSRVACHAHLMPAVSESP
jgi:hypothetical protein